MRLRKLKRLIYGTIIRYMFLGANEEKLSLAKIATLRAQ